MKTLTFKYTKKDGSVSERVLLAMVEPTDKYAGIDVSDIDPEHAEKFMQHAMALHKKYVESLQELQRLYDVTHNYRQFLKSGVSDLSVL